MTRPVVPIANLNHRLPEAGRIRTGVKTARAMKAIDTFRFTSSDQTAIEQVAAIYGGTPQPWTGAPTEGQWEVITEAPEIHVVLPPDPLGGTPIYEQWSGGGCQRRCNGETCTINQQGPDGPEPTDVPCLCVAKGEMTCDVKTRLSVILPDVRFAGTWRYESAKSWNVAQELPAMVELIQSLQARGLTRALLGIEHRKSVAGGKTHKYTIPVLRVADSMDALVAGVAQVRALPTTAVAELGSGSSEGGAEISDGSGGPEAAATPPSDTDDEIHDAEIVEDSQPQLDLDGPPTEQVRIAAALAKADARERWKNSEFTKALTAEEIPVNESRWTQGQALRIVEIHAEMIAAGVL